MDEMVFIVFRILRLQYRMREFVIVTSFKFSSPFRFKFFINWKKLFFKFFKNFETLRKASYRRNRSKISYV
ncbi:hypothetical protein BpHYR1_051590 [Brachionus plicatilis]|uniref:Uncharacterized protein n=1 Tax=Brachionus plicatilis TaxID=10195 RepID=A0A3M7PQL1_BRAPC|nr:hypothetical protein BpHYR1_051590 [Brachionus plicatilis]